MTLSDSLALEAKVVSGGHLFTEGPVWHPDGFLLFSDIPNRQILKWCPKTRNTVPFFTGSSCNGLSVDKAGCVYVCGHSDRNLYQLKRSSGAHLEKTVLVADFEGKPLNSPNDLILDEDGAWLMFSDPIYGISPKEQEQRCRGVFFLDLHTGKMELVLDNLKTPNGIARSADGKYAYIADTETNSVFKYSLIFDTLTRQMKLSDQTLFAHVPLPDGLKEDLQGYVYITSHVQQGGIHIFNGRGQKIGHISTPNATSNCAFSAPKQDTLYITSGKEVLLAKLPHANTK